MLKKNQKRLVMFFRVILIPCLAICFLSISLTSQIAFGSLYGSAALYAQSNPIVDENENVGTTDWQLTDAADDFDLQIKGYASATSINAGASIDFFVTVTSTTSLNFTIDIYRMGWYQGTGGRFIMQMGPLVGKEQDPPNIDVTTGLIEANWDTPHTLITNANWTSGVYLAKLENADGKQNYIKFVVRNDSNSADFLYHHADTTDQAYNLFPRDDATGKSLYKGWGPQTVAGDRAVKVSFDRPYERDGSGQFFRWEYPLIRWLEKEGYHLTYASDMDTHKTGTGVNNYLRDYNAVLSAGHDEYFSKEMFDAFEDARDNGVHLAFFGSNAVYWQVRFEDSDRTMVSYKDASLDPETNAALETDKFRSVGRPEQQLIGVQFDKFASLSDPSIYTDYIVQNSDHWSYSCSGLNNNDAVSKLVGYEVDADFGVSPPAQSGSYVFLSASDFVGTSGSTTAKSSIYQATSGAWVFATGTLNWSLGLADGSTILDYSGMPSTLVDSRIQRTTANILNAFASGVLPGAGTQQLEAEGGTGFGNYTVVYDTAASNGKYIHFPTGHGGGSEINANHPNYVEYCFTVTQPGTYRITGRTYAQTAINNSFWVQVDGLPTGGYRWDLAVPLGAYNDDLIDDWDVSLAAGEHVIRVTQREPQARLDTIGLELLSASSAPGAVTLQLPNGNISSTSPTFQWLGDAVATEYWLVVYNETTDQIIHTEENIAAATAGCASGGTCVYTPSMTLTAGDAYRWLIKASNLAGPGPWSTFP